MSCGRPIVAAVNGDSETAMQIRNANGGVIIEPENPGLLADTLRSLKRNQGLLEQLGRNGAEYILKNFEQRLVLDTFFDKFQVQLRNGT